MGPYLNVENQFFFNGILMVTLSLQKRNKLWIIVCVQKKGLARKKQFDLLLNCEMVQGAFVLYWSSFMYQSKIFLS